MPRSSRRGALHCGMSVILSPGSLRHCAGFGYKGPVALSRGPRDNFALNCGQGERVRVPGTVRVRGIDNPSIFCRRSSFRDTFILNNIKIAVRPVSVWTHSYVP